MEADFELEPLTAQVAAQVRQIRARRGLSTRQLAERCKELGMPGLNRRVLSNLENRRRGYVTVAELLVLGWALNASPVNLMLPEPDDEIAIVPGEPVQAWMLRQWVRGHLALPYGEASEDEFADTIPAFERRERRANSHGAMKELDGLRSVVRMAVNREVENVTPELLAELLERTYADFGAHVAELTKALRDEGDR